MKIKTIDYDLPEELIAQKPLRRRDDSRLLIIDPASDDVYHGNFIDIVDHLKNGDLLVFNDSKVIPARLYGFKDETYAKVELLLLHMPIDNCASALVKNARAVKVGTKIIFASDFHAIALRRHSNGIIDFQFYSEGDLMETIHRLGELPLPPYIKKYKGDRERYQTIYAKNYGSVAAPTAGLHFTPTIMEIIKSRQIKVAYITLHVGLGTFKPITTPYLHQHKMHEEMYTIGVETATMLNQALLNSDRIVAVGTTTLRALETNYRRYKYFMPTTEFTSIFIYPPQEVQSVDLLITNLHQPRSTLLLLVMAIAGEKLTLRAYKEAIKRNYRFLSFGDACVINNNHYHERLFYRDNMAMLLNITKLQIANKRGRLLLHVCCAPCLMLALDFLVKHYHVTLLYDNSNIVPREEFDKRLAAIKTYLNVFNVKNQTNVELIVAKYYKSFHLENAKYASLEERNFRCFNCIERRFRSVLRYFENNRYKFDFVATTLTASEYKSTVMVNDIGLNVFGKIYIPTNFRVGAKLPSEAGSYHRALGIYRQKYCGCNPAVLSGFSKLGLRYDDFLKNTGEEELEPGYELDTFFQHKRRGDPQGDLFRRKERQDKLKTKT